MALPAAAENSPRRATERVTASTSASPETAATATTLLSPGWLRAMATASVTTASSAPKRSTSKMSNGFFRLNSVWPFTAVSFRAEARTNARPAIAAAATSRTGAMPTASRRLIKPVTKRTRRNMTQPEARIPPARRRTWLALSRARRASESVTAVEANRPPSRAARIRPALGPASLTMA